MYKPLTFIGITFIVLVILINNNDAELVKTHDIKVVKFNYGKEHLISTKGQSPEVQYVEIKSYHGKEYKIYTKKDISIPASRMLTIYEYKRNHSDMHFFTLHKK